MTTSTLTFDVAEGAARLGVSTDWYMRQLRARKLPGHKLGNRWRLTNEDVERALELTAIAANPSHTDPAGLTPGSRRRLNRGTR
ncbi:helix-turn-helix domain-containing protein [Rhodococcoides fascians]|uniref:helix-turn-helix domain-containing protein n=1 Tax=Rhodococcoides fascians TaxID=1828 RepID=UPI0037AA94AD